jgi:hypothetical protein
MPAEETLAAASAVLSQPPIAVQYQASTERLRPRIGNRGVTSIYWTKGLCTFRGNLLSLAETLVISHLRANTSFNLVRYRLRTDLGIFPRILRRVRALSREHVQ